MAGLALLVVSLYLIQRGRFSLPYLLPMAFMLVGTLAAMVLKLRDFLVRGETLLLIVGSTTSGNAEDGAKVYTRVIQIMIAVTYVVVAFGTLERFRRKEES